MDKCNEVAIKEISRGLELMTQLRALLLPISTTDTHCSDLATGLFEYTLQAFSTALAALQPPRGPEPSCVSPGTTSIGSACSNDRAIGSSDNKKRKNSNEEEEEEEEIRNGTGDRKRRRMSGGNVIITSVPHNDGRQWRKYGQKYINGSIYPRSYYRCAYGRDGVQGCPAAKSIQQMDGGDPPKYTVIYKMQHSCKRTESGSRKVMDSMPRNASRCLQQSKGSEGNSQKSLAKQHPLATSPLPAQEISSTNDDTGTTILPLSFELETMRNSASNSPDMCEVMSIWELESYGFEEEWMNYMNSVGSNKS